MRFRILAAAVLLGSVAGCSEFAFVLRPPPFFIGVATWTLVPEGEYEVQAKAGDVLHLPLGPTWGGRGGLPFLYSVTVDGEAPEHPVYVTSADKTCYVFDAVQAGEFVVESDNGLSDKSRRTWHITVAE